MENISISSVNTNVQSQCMIHILFVLFNNSYNFTINKNQRMKNQLFFLFYEDENDMNFKLLKTYVNRFIICEDAECEILEAYKLSKPSEFEFSEYTLIQKIQNLYSFILQSKFKNIYIIAETLDKASEHSMLTKDEDFQMHCLIGMPLEFTFFLYLISVKYSTHCSVICSQSESFITKKELHASSFNEIETQNIKNSNGLNITIGDDIDLFIHSFHKFKPSLNFWNPIVDEQMISYKLLHEFERKKSYSRALKKPLFEESEDIFMKIDCKRKFIPRQAHPYRSILFIFVYTVAAAAIVLLAPVWYRKISKKALDILLNYFNQRFPINQSIPINFCILCIRQVSLAYLIWKCRYNLINYFRDFNSLMEVCIRLALCEEQMPVTYPTVSVCILFIYYLLCISLCLFFINSEIVFIRNCFHKI